MKLLLTSLALSALLCGAASANPTDARSAVSGTVAQRAALAQESADANPLLRTYYAVVSDGVLTPALKVCGKKSLSAVKSMRIVAAVTSRGAPVAVQVEPPSPFGKCLVKQLSQQTWPSPGPLGGSALQPMSFELRAAN